jgi:hypothetical protein
MYVEMFVTLRLKIQLMYNGVYWPLPFAVTRLVVLHYGIRFRKL